jgi:hypothetical protein
MSTYQSILSDLIARHEGTLDDERLVEYAQAAETLAALGAKAPPLRAAPPDPAIARDARIRELQAETGKGTEAQRCARSAELTKLLASKHKIGNTDQNGWTRPYRDPDGGEAA